MLAQNSQNLGLPMGFNHESGQHVHLIQIDGYLETLRLLINFHKKNFRKPLNFDQIFMKINEVDEN